MKIQTHIKSGGKRPRHQANRSTFSKEITVTQSLLDVLAVGPRCGLWRLLFRPAAAAVLITLVSSAAYAQAPRSVQAVAPVQGATTWRSDNCSYVFLNSRWQRQDLCRVMRGPATYDTFRPSTRAWLTRYDESTAGWVKGLDLNQPNASWIAIHVSGRILVQRNNQWIEVTQVPQQSASSEAQQLAIICRNQRTGMSPTATPNDPRCRTAADQGTVAITSSAQGIAARSSCETRQDSVPYLSREVGRDGRTSYRLRNGSVQPQGGTLNDGWSWGANGQPYRQACY